jgi:uncharacterized membrane protein
MGLLSRRPFTKAEEARLVAAIGRAEANNRGEVRVHVDPRKQKQAPLDRAAVLFRALGMGTTRADTAVLLYVALADRKTAVYAGKGIHGAAEPGFWQSVTDAVGAGAAKGDLTGGLEAALDLVGAVLREHAPGDDEAGNELPDAVSVGE